MMLFVVFVVDVFAACVVGCLFFCISCLFGLCGARMFWFVFLFVVCMLLLRCVC